VAPESDNLKRVTAIRHYLEMGRFEQVAELTRSGLAENPEDGYLYYMMALCQYHWDQHAECEDSLNASLRYGFNPEYISELRGDLYMDTERWSEAEQSYAYLMLKTGHIDKANQLLKKSLQLNPEDITVLRYQHLFQLVKSNKEEQLLALERFMQYADDEVSKHIQMGLNELYHNRLKSAKEHFRQAYILNPTSKPLQDMLGSLTNDSHWFLVPMNWAEKIGGSGVIYIIGIGSIMGTRALGWNQVSTALLIIYLTFVVYSWSAVGLAKIMRK
jgi:tetratricopeptide (TPR) repeat protein